MKELMLQTQTEEAKSLPAVRTVEEPIAVQETVRKKIEELKAMGFHTAAKLAEAAHKMSLAYGEYTFISMETINKFNEKLKEETLQENARARTFKQLTFTPIDKYNKIPPLHVLDAIAKARKKEIFDSFMVGKISWIEEIKDPIVFGKVDGCPDYFYIAQWDDDISIEELLSI